MDVIYRKYLSIYGHSDIYTEHTHSTVKEDRETERERERQKDRKLSRIILVKYYLTVTAVNHNLVTQNNERVIKEKKKKKRIKITITIKHRHVKNTESLRQTKESAKRRGIASAKEREGERIKATKGMSDANLMRQKATNEYRRMDGGWWMVGRDG